MKVFYSFLCLLIGMLDLSSNKVEDAVKNGVRVDNDHGKPDEIICILANDGSVILFGIFCRTDWSPLDNHPFPDFPGNQRCQKMLKKRD